MSDKKPQELTVMQPGQTLSFELKESGNKVEVNKLILQKSLLEQVVFNAKDGDFHKERFVRTPEIVQVYKEVSIKYSLSLDGLEAGIDQSILNQLSNIFAWDIDFALDLREGDTFSLLYEEKLLDGKLIGFGNILAAQFVNNGKTFQAVRFETSRGSHYYTPDGLSMRKAFIRTPVEFSRISSSFNPKRLHPIFKTARPHRGVDYAASTGTPIKASGDGKIIFKGKQNGYGNVVIINHGRGYTTLYGHMSRFVRSLKRGSKVKQGQVIGYVGQTGYATGPHLHYEFRINGKHQNPVTVKLPNDIPMTKKDLKRYLPYAQQMMSSLRSYHSHEYAQKLAKLKLTSKK
ncbi:peptidase M23 [Marinomonas agarivorans]|nr:peptidase M23 [Marinomonas agarivorans]